MVQVKTNKNKSSHLLLASAQRIPLSLHHPHCLGEFDILEVTRVLAFGIELEKGICRALDLSLIFDG